MWGSSSYARSSYMGANGFDFEYVSNIQLRLKFLFLSLYICLAQRPI